MKIVLIDDEPEVRKLCSDSLRHSGFEVIEANGQYQGAAAISANPDFGVLIGDSDSLTEGLVKLAREISPRAKIVSFSGRVHPPKVKVDAVILKPIQQDKFVSEVQALVE